MTYLPVPRACEGAPQRGARAGSSPRSQSRYAQPLSLSRPSPALNSFFQPYSQPRADPSPRSNSQVEILRFLSGIAALFSNSQVESLCFSCAHFKFRIVYDCNRFLAKKRKPTIAPHANLFQLSPGPAAPAAVTD